MRKRDTPSQIVEHDRENNLPDMEIQLPMSLHQNHENETFEDKNSARKDVRQNGTGPANENSLIQEQSYSTSMEDCKGFKETRNSRVNKGKQNATPNLQIQILEEGQTKASSCSLEPTKDFQPGHDDNGAISMSHNRHQKKDPAKLRKQNATPNPWSSSGRGIQFFLGTNPGSAAWKGQRCHFHLPKSTARKRV